MNFCDGQLGQDHKNNGADSLKSPDEGVVHSEGSVYTEYADPKRSGWITKIQPELKKVKLAVLVKAYGKRLSHRKIIELRAQRKNQHRKTQELLEAILEAPPLRGANL